MCYSKHRISLTFVFVFLSHKLPPVLLSTASIASSSSSSSLLFRLPSDDHGPLGPSTSPGSRCLEILGSGLSYPGLHWIIAHLCFTISLYLYLYLRLLLIILCDLPSSRGGQEVVCLILHTSHTVYHLYYTFCQCNL